MQSDEQKIKFLKARLRELNQNTDEFWIVCARIGMLYLRSGFFEKGWRWYTSRGVADSSWASKLETALGNSGCVR